MKRSAVVAVGEPVDTGVYLAEHDARGARKETILRLTPDLQRSIQTMVHASNAAIDAGGRA